MQQRASITFRCTKEFRNRFFAAARLRGTTGQDLLMHLAEQWLESGELPAKEHARSPTGEQSNDVNLTPDIEVSVQERLVLDQVLSILRSTAEPVRALLLSTLEAFQRLMELDATHSDTTESERRRVRRTLESNQEVGSESLDSRKQVQGGNRNTRQ